MKALFDLEKTKTKIDNFPSFNVIIQHCFVDLCIPVLFVVVGVHSFQFHLHKM